MASQLLLPPRKDGLHQKFSSQRAQFASELQTEVSRIGGDAETSGSVVGAAHRVWLNLKSAITGEKDSAVISECERGEDAAKEAYSKASAKDLPGDIQAIVQRHYREVVQAHNQVRALEVKTSGGAA